ncbi:MAG: HlyD family efflux transporter periplasmic adaptor subunit [Bacteroidales bacterium]|jgi:HlyD family secretion protein
MNNNPLPYIPFENVEISLHQNTIKTKSIYLIIVFLVLTILLLLPILKVSLSVQGRGIIRPMTEKAEIKALQSELITSVLIAEGQFVERGDTLIILRQDIMQSKFLFLRQELFKYQLFINDLDQLTKQDRTMLRSSIYLGQFKTYKNKLREIESKIIKAKNEVKRNKGLFEKEIIAQKEFDDLRFNLNQLEQEKSIFESNQVAHWKADLEKYKTNVNDLKKQIAELEKQKQFYIITAPVSGTIEEFSGIYVGSMLQAGQTIAIISPESDKIAEVYVSAKDIGYLCEGQSTRIQVDAFNYNQWGSLHGEIVDISDDFILADNTPVFNVKCNLDKDYLELKNGVKGKLKKGMTVNARFMIARRSIFQLLFQKSDDWLNPSRSLASQ